MGIMGIMAAMDETQVQQLMDALWRTRETLGRTEAELHGLHAALATLVDILAEKGVLANGHRRVFARILAKGKAGDNVELRTGIDKYAVPEADIDCASLAHLCHLRCCALRITLGEQDLDEGGIAWEHNEPYILKRRFDGYCTYIDRQGASGCTIYERRPATCRQYDCRHDPRIWLDFDNRIPAPMPSGLIPVARLIRQ